MLAGSDDGLEVSSRPSARASARWASGEAAWGGSRAMGCCGSCSWHTAGPSPSPGGLGTAVDRAYLPRSRVDGQRVAGLLGGGGHG